MPMQQGLELMATTFAYIGTVKGWLRMAQLLAWVWKTMIASIAFLHKARL
jgi:hypothetical protein